MIKLLNGLLIPILKVGDRVCLNSSDTYREGIVVNVEPMYQSLMTRKTIITLVQIMYNVKINPYYSCFYKVKLDRPFCFCTVNTVSRFREELTLIK